MLIAGFGKLSMLDYPGKLAAIVFTPYCNWRCWYCHNAHILSGEIDLIPEDYVLEFLNERKSRLEGLVISGGEPTMRPDLPLFAEKVKQMGYAIKLDTNGSNPKMLRSMLERGLLDYIAMDIHAPEDKYQETVCASVKMDDVFSSIRLIMESGIDYEFRTTFAPTLDKQDILNIADMIPSAKAFYLQQYRPAIPKPGEAPAKAMPFAHSGDYVRETAAAMKEKLGKCEIRGL